MTAYRTFHKPSTSYKVLHAREHKVIQEILVQTRNETGRDRYNPWRREPGMIRAALFNPVAMPTIKAIILHTRAKGIAGIERPEVLPDPYA